MSDLLSPADALADHLRAQPPLTGVPIIVARQLDLQSTIDQALAKATGAAVLIALDGWRPIAVDGWDRTLTLQHSISVWTQPLLLHPDQRAEPDILSHLIGTIQGHCPDPDQPLWHWTTLSGRYVAHPDYRVYEFPAEIQHYLAPYQP